jgi:hypothetical protein
MEGENGPMNTRLTVAIAIVSGLSGGLLARYVAPPPVFAQDQATPITKEIRAQNFVLVDSFNRTIGAFTAERVSRPPGGAGVLPGATFVGRMPPKYPPLMRMVLRGSDGQEIWSVTEDSK